MSLAGARVAVIGGGLAGIACALDCAAEGAEVVLLEVRRRLGGAAYSFARDDMRLDNGQHVFLRCCHAYRGLLRRLGSEALTRVQDKLEIPVLSPGRRPAKLVRGGLPAPLHLAGTLARYPYLTVGERMRAAWAALALAHVNPHEAALDRIGFGEWLASHGQGERAIAALWDLIALPSLNLKAAEASAALGAFVFQTGLFASADGGDIGFHEGPLGEILDLPAQRTLADAGVEVRLGWRAQAIERTAHELAVHGEGEEEAAVTADAVVVATPHIRAARLIEPLLPELASRLGGIGSSPIVNLHVVYDRRVCEERFAAGVRSPVQYLFDRSATGGIPAGCQYLAVSLSGAEPEMQMSAERLRERYLPALAALLPRAGEAKVERFFVTREHAATFRAAPGVGALRPAARTPLPGLVLAGAWTDTGWPATLEGAVKSGHTAAREALASL